MAFLWSQGEHVTLIGRTGSGKTSLARELLKLRRYVIVMLSKPDPLIWPGTWKRISTVKQVDVADATRYLLKPSYERQASEFYQAFSMAWEQGGWCVYIDELYYMQRLGLEESIVKLLTQGRSNFLTVVCGVQRPAWVSRFAFSEPRYVISAKLGDRADIRRVGEIVGEGYVQECEKLDWHEFLVLDRQTDTMQMVTRDTVADVFKNVASSRKAG